MFKSIKKFFAVGSSVDYAKLVKQGAVILDVRTKREYATGHVKGSVNISLDHLEADLHTLSDKLKPIVTCCASGVRSSAAKRILEANGYTKVYNAGSWTGLNNKL